MTKRHITIQFAYKIFVLQTIICSFDQLGKRVLFLFNPLALSHQKQKKKTSSDQQKVSHSRFIALKMQVISY